MNAAAAVLVLAAALLFGNNLKLPAFLQPKPKTAQLSQTELDLATARAAQASAEAKLHESEAKQAAVKDRQVEYAQEMTQGAVLALSNVGPGQLTPEVRLARDFSLRAQAGLDAARGRLSPDLQAEIEHLVGQALSAKTAEVEAYKLAIAAKDAALSQTIVQKAALEAVLPTLRADVEVEKAKTATVEAKAAVLIRQVSDFADKKDAADREAGSWRNYFMSSVKILGGLLLLAGLAYTLIHVFLPSMGQSYPGSNWEKVALFLRNSTSTHDHGL